MLERQQLPYVLAGVFLMTLQPLLVTLSQNEEGQIEYSSMSSTLFSESLKLLLSLAFSWSQLRSGTPPPLRLDRRKALEFAVPALIYFVNNNLVFVILARVSATTFQLLSQLKTVFTGLLFRCFLSRQLTFYQYMAIWYLTCGTAVSQLPSGGMEGSSLSGQRMDASFSGLLLSVVSCVLSAFGGIYSEKLLKDQPKESIHWQNVQLYFWGIVFNFVALLLHGAAPLQGLFSGFDNPWAGAVVLNNALNGLAISAILKYADNIARVYAHACAMLVTMLVSAPLLGQRPTPQLLIGIAVVAASAVQYNVRPEHLGSPEKEKAEEEHSSARDVRQAPEGEVGFVDTRSYSGAATERPPPLAQLPRPGGHCR